MPLRIVQPGMMIDQAIIDRAGRVLIVRRTPLEDFHIDALKKMGVTGIYTCEGTEDVKPGAYSICIRIRSHRISPMLHGVLRMICFVFFWLMMKWQSISVP